MCISSAKAPSAIETLLELCLHVGKSLTCTQELLKLPQTTAQEILCHVVPFLKGKILEVTTYDIRSSIYVLQYTSACGAIFNNLFMNGTVKITRDNIDFHESQMKEVCFVHDAWSKDDLNARTKQK